MFLLKYIYYMIKKNPSIKQYCLDRLVPRHICIVFIGISALIFDYVCRYFRYYFDQCKVREINSFFWGNGTTNHYLNYDLSNKQIDEKCSSSYLTRHGYVFSHLALALFSFTISVISIGSLVITAWVASKKEKNTDNNKDTPLQNVIYRQLSTTDNPSNNVQEVA